MSEVEGKSEPGNGAHDRSRTVRETQLEDIVAEFLFRRESGEEPSIEEYQARYPRFAEDLAFLLADDLGISALPGMEVVDSTMTIARDRGGLLHQLGPYEILEHVAKGGGGTVYRARHRRDQHLVALKVLDRLAVADPRDLERFEREARMLRSMDVAGIVPVYDVGQDEDRLYIAMKWIEGTTLGGLKDLVKSEDHPLHDLKERARLIARIARTFGAIHGYGILHRDIKPSNILIDRLNQPVIIDFGIARAQDLDHLTMSIDGPMGTPRYLAPELLQGGNHESSARADVYGLGLCLYELVTGVSSFVQRTKEDLYAQIRSQGLLDPRRANPEISFELGAIVLRATELKPASRYASMGEFATDLEAYARGEEISSLTMRRASPLRRFVVRRKKQLIVGALGAFVAAVAIDFFLDWAMTRAEREDLKEKLRPFEFAPPELFPFDHQTLVRDAARLVDLAGDDPVARASAVWVAFLAGKHAEAVQSLGPKRENEPSTLRYLRRYIDLYMDRLENIDNPLQAPTVNYPHAPNRSGASGEGVLISEARELTPEEESRRRRFRPVELENVDALIEASAAWPKDAHFHLIQALTLWISLPINTQLPESAEEAKDHALQAVSAALALDPELAAARYLRAFLNLRFGKPSDARSDLASLRAKGWNHAQVLHLEGLAYSPWLVDGADVTIATARFQAAADAYQRNPPPSGVFELEPLRRLYAAWAYVEARAGRGVALDGVLKRWSESIREPVWQDRVFPLLMRAQLAEKESRMTDAIAILEEAAAINEKYALPLLEVSRIYEDHLDDANTARRVAARAKSRPQTAPDSITTYLRASAFGLRPFGLETSFVSSSEPLRDGQPIR